MFPYDFYALGDELHYKFCQYNLEWKCVTMCKDQLACKAHEKNKDNTVLYMLSNGKIHVKGEKTEFH